MSFAIYTLAGLNDELVLKKKRRIEKYIALEVWGFNWWIELMIKVEIVLKKLN